MKFNIKENINNKKELKDILNENSANFSDDFFNSMPPYIKKDIHKFLISKYLGKENIDELTTEELFNKLDNDKLLSTLIKKFIIENDFNGDLEKSSEYNFNDKTSFEKFLGHAIAKIKSKIKNPNLETGTIKLHCYNGEFLEIGDISSINSKGIGFFNYMDDSSDFYDMDDIEFIENKITENPLEKFTIKLLNAIQNSVKE